MILTDEGKETFSMWGIIYFFFPSITYLPMRTWVSEFSDTYTTQNAGLVAFSVSTTLERGRNSKSSPCPSWSHNKAVTFSLTETHPSPHNLSSPLSKSLSEATLESLCFLLARISKPYNLLFFIISASSNLLSRTCSFTFFGISYLY